MTDETRTMQPVARRAGNPSSAGLLLLYAEPTESVPSVVALDDKPLVVGREAPSGGLRLDQSALSRLHAKLTPRPEGWQITDLESRNGTFVDGSRITAPAILRDGAEIRIGDSLFKFVAREIEAYAPYRVDGTLAPGARRRSTAVPSLVGGYRMDCVAAAIEAGARSDLSVLVRGETGTGKEIVARAVHGLSGRTGTFCAINCAAVPGNLFESELFGVRKGAFTGADRDRPGIVKTADGGTLFLDEVGDMPLEMQAKLLRVLEAREVRPLGATAPQPVDVRVVCATHRDLHTLVAEGRFRGDLLARLKAYEIVLAPLRERKEDLFQLVRHFLRSSARPDLGITFGFMLAVCDHDWPFNVRECEAAVRRAVAIADGRALLDVGDLPEEVQARASSYGSRPIAGETQAGPRRAPSADQLRAQLARHKGNVAAVARELGKDPRQVHRWMHQYGISPGPYRG
jgi:transcriptional regulator with PAS, ATPase and Fis domain